jgi:hypothetical protein
LRPPVVIALVLLGTSLRLAGLLFNGQHDLDVLIFDWGSAVWTSGIGTAFSGVYGAFMYGILGLAAGAAELIPRFWWAPIKLFEVGTELAILVVLALLLPAGRRHWALWLYWLNPWFILHGAWQGFMDGPHTLFGLLALLVIERIQRVRLRWLLVGVLVGSSAMLKPQGLAYWVLPLAIYCAICLVRGSAIPAFWAGLGGSLALGAAIALVALSGGDPTQIPASYIVDAQVMPALCNNCVGVWRPITGLLQSSFGETGPAYMLVLPAAWDALLNSLGIGLAYAAIAVSCLVVALRSRSPGFVLVAGAVIVPQIATHAHINHTYAGMVLMLPWVIGRSVATRLWMLVVAVLFYAHLAAYQLGRSVVLPEYVPLHESGRRLFAMVQAAAPLHSDPLLAFQSMANQVVSLLAPVEPVVTFLSIVEFVAIVVLLVQLPIWPRVEGLADAIRLRSAWFSRGSVAVRRQHER